MPIWISGLSKSGGRSGTGKICGMGSGICPHCEKFGPWKWGQVYFVCPWCNRQLGLMPMLPRAVGRDNPFWSAVCRRPDKLGGPPAIVGPVESIGAAGARVLAEHSDDDRFAAYFLIDPEWTNAFWLDANFLAWLETVAPATLKIWRNNFLLSGGNQEI